MDVIPKCLHIRMAGLASSWSNRSDLFVFLQRWTDALPTLMYLPPVLRSVLEREKFIELTYSQLNDVLDVARWHMFSSKSDT